MGLNNKASNYLPVMPRYMPLATLMHNLDIDSNGYRRPDEPSNNCVYVAGFHALEHQKWSVGAS